MEPQKTLSNQRNLEGVKKTQQRGQNIQWRKFL